jgi:hypothetical protein
MWDQDIALSAEFSSSNLILASCTYVNTTVKFGLICMYGDPHHRTPPLYGRLSVLLLLNIWAAYVMHG